MVPCMALIQNQTSASDDGAPFEQRGILLEGTNFVKAPGISFMRPGANWTYPYSNYPVYVEGQNISGGFLGSVGLAGMDVEICLSNFSITDFLGSRSDFAKIKCAMPQIRLNGTGGANFAIDGISAGTYTLSVIDGLNSSLLYALPLIVTPQDIIVDSQSTARAGDALKVNVKMPQGPDNLSRYYGAVIVSRKDYEGAKLEITSNGNDSKDDLKSTIAFGNRSIQIQGLPTISTDLFMNISTILPQNSAVSMEKSSKPEAEFYLMTDPEWERGSYILTCAVYSSGKGVLGMKQMAVEVT